MGEYTDKAKGAVNKTIGKAKVEAGQRADKPDLIVKGAAQQAKGKTQKATGELKGLKNDLD